MSGPPPQLGVPVDQLGRERVAPTVSSTPANQPVAKSSTLGSSIVCAEVIWMRHLPLAMQPPKKLRVLASSTTSIVDTSAAVAASMVVQWLVTATVQVVLLSVAAFVLLLPSNSVKNEGTRSHGAESSSARQL